jgi:hypothetical protein
MLERLLGALLGAPAEQIGEYLRQKQQLKHDLKKAKLEGKIKVEEAKADARAAKAAHIATWEMASMANSGWKDEFVLLLIAIPLPLSFVPWTQEFVRRGFEVLGTTPYWYMGLVLSVFLAIYGIRWKGAESISLRK